MVSSPSFWRLLDQAYLGVNRYVVDRLHAAGFAEIRPAHAKVFENLDDGGTTVTALAERAQVTKQAMGELAIALEQLEYVQRVPDPSDRRAKLVTLTPRGDDAVRSAGGILDELWSDVERTVGRDELLAAQGVLQRLVRLLEDGGALDQAGGDVFDDRSARQR
jgi:DNA-binding MarR family transcriptional regulator